MICESRKLFGNESQTVKLLFISKACEKKGLECSGWINCSNSQMHEAKDK